MNKNVMWMALLLACSSSVAMAQIDLNFLYGPGARVTSDNGDSITLDFGIDGTGVVSLDANPVGTGTNSGYLDAVNSWDSVNIGTAAAAALWGTSFQITIFGEGGGGSGTDTRLTLDDNGTSNPGSLGHGGTNSSRVDGNEILHFQQTGGTAQIQLMAFGYHGNSTTIDPLWDTRLIAGGVDNVFADLASPGGTVDVSAFGYVIGSGANELTFRLPDEDLANPTFNSHGLGVTGLTLQAVQAVPEPATFGLLAAFGTALMVRRRRS